MRLISLLIAIAFTGIISGQENISPTNSIMRYDDSPVDLFTGVPDVKVPFVMLPTRNKDFIFNIDLQYHPLNGVAAGALGGFYGLGWNILNEGSILGDIKKFKDSHSGYNPDETCVYQFNFMGYSGKFKLTQKNGEKPKLTEINSKGSKPVLEIETVVDSTTVINTTSYLIISFSFFDEKGYKYFFENKTDGGFDTAGQAIDLNGNHSKWNWRLTKIYDNNGKELIYFDYQNFPAASPPYKNYFGLKQIVSNGFGTINLNQIYNSYPLVKTTEIVFSDAYGNSLKKMELTYSYDELTSAQISDMGEALKETYEFSYHHKPVYGDTYAYDSFGFQTLKPDCSESEEGEYGVGIYPPSQSQCTNGVLKRIKLPTGGCILYDYESNTYSRYDNNHQLKEEPDQFLDHDLHFVDPSTGTSYFPLIPENYIESEYLSHSFGLIKSKDISLTGLKDFYFNVFCEPYTVEPGDGNPLLTPRTFYPKMQIKGKTSNCSFPAGKILDSSKNYLNKCLGEKVHLEPGDYTISIFFSSEDNALLNAYGHFLVLPNGSFQINEVTVNPNRVKHFYGGGIRIKRISYFDIDAPYGYDNMISQGHFPAKELNYSYNFFNKPDFSSGYLTSPDSVFDEYGDLLNQLTFGGYTNVTVYQSPNNGKTRHTFMHETDSQGLNENNSMYFAKKRGLLLKKELFDTSNFLLNSTDYLYGNEVYTFTENGATSSNPFVGDYLLLDQVSQIVDKKYFKNSSNFLADIQYFGYYHDNFNLKNYGIVSSSGDLLKTTYSYDLKPNPNYTQFPYGQNRIAELSESKTYRGTELLSINKINYSNTWTGNQSYLPQTVEVSKGTQSSTIKSRINLRDEYSHVLEEKQENGMITSYIYGYNKTYLVAKLQNIAYGNIPPSLITAIQNATNISSTDAAIAALQASTDSNMQNAMITTYTYNPLVGVSTVTDPKGDKISYEYDGLGRLITVKDKDGYLLSETEYKFQNQN